MGRACEAADRPVPVRPGGPRSRGHLTSAPQRSPHPLPSPTQSSGPCEGTGRVPGCHCRVSRTQGRGCAVRSSGLTPCFSPSRKQVLGTKVDAERDGVKVPTTLAEYCVKTKTPAPNEGSDLFYDYYYEDDEMEEEADSCYGDEDDSGNEES